MKLRLLIFLLLVLVLTACASQSTRPSPIASSSPSAKPPEPTSKQLKFETFQLPTTSPAPSSEHSPQPEPSTICPRYVPVPSPQCVCSEFPTCTTDTNIGCWLSGELCKQYATNPVFCGPPYSDGNDNSECNQKFRAGTCQLWCAAKPVIYLYPTLPTVLDVALQIPGRITISDPLYPDGGWKQVQAAPNGILTYQGHTYPYLYYETEVEKPAIPTQGWVIRTTHLKPMLSLLTERFGLLPKEQNDFLDYWVPRLTSLNRPYIFTTLITPQEKARVDHIVVSQEPNTRIELLFSFTPLEKEFSVTPLPLPANPPRRVGFTLVEWGGGITYQ